MSKTVENMSQKDKALAVFLTDRDMLYYLVCNDPNAAKQAFNALDEDSKTHVRKAWEGLYRIHVMDTHIWKWTQENCSS